MIDAQVHSEIAFANTGRETARNLGIGLTISLGFLAVGGLWFGGQVQALRAALPAVATIIGLVLYLTRPILYVQYSLWVWFLTPLVRRIVDWHFGYMDPNAVLLTPFLVAGISGLTVIRPNQRLDTRVPMGFVLCGMAVVYGFIVGMILHPSAETVFGLLNWLCPLLFGLHIYLNWERYEEYRAAITRTFLWGVLILGLYGIYQYFLPPEWDRYWLINASLNSLAPSFGQPESLLVRVWSTLNAPGPFANTMMVGLLSLFVVQSPLKVPAAAVGSLSFLLSGVRTAWISWILGLIWFLKRTKPHSSIRIILSLVVLLACLLAFANDTTLAPAVVDRLKTFTDLNHDESFGARVEMYRVLLNDAFENPFGHGLKNLETARNIPVDSGILVMIFSLGWLGIGLFAVGIFTFFFRPESRQGNDDDFTAVANALMVAIVAQVIGGNIFVNVTGALFWVSVAMHSSGLKRCQNQQAVSLREDGDHFASKAEYV
jgi:hypothetical protein